MITIGIDSGSLTTKGVILKKNDILSYSIIKTGGDNSKSAEKVLERILGKANLKNNEVNYIMSTGYGRENIPFANGNISEISCHAMGMNFVYPEVKTLLDIGGQDSKSIRVDEYGKSENFIMNDKCAAGTGRFLEVVANALEVKLEELGELSLSANNCVKISNMCTVFAESEVISLVAKGTKINDILLGVHHAIAERSLTLLNKIGIVPPIAMSGGVALNSGVVNSIEKLLEEKIYIPKNPQIIGALGAAKLAQKKLVYKT